EPLTAAPSALSSSAGPFALQRLSPWAAGCARTPHPAAPRRPADVSPPLHDLKGLVDVHAAAAAEDRTALGELARRGEAVGLHHRVAGEPRAGAVADRASRADGR